MNTFSDCMELDWNI